MLAYGWCVRKRRRQEARAYCACRSEHRKEGTNVLNFWLVSQGDNFQLRQDERVSKKDNYTKIGIMNMISQIRAFQSLLTTKMRNHKAEASYVIIIWAGHRKRKFHRKSFERDPMDHQIQTTFLSTNKSRTRGQALDRDLSLETKNGGMLDGGMGSQEHCAP